MGWMLMVIEQSKQRQLFLDGIVHEIKSDTAPLRKALESLRERNHEETAWRVSQYCATRLDMAVQNLLLLSRGLPNIQSKISTNLSTILRNLCEYYQPDIADRKKSITIEPSLPDSTNLDIVNSIWMTPLPMSEEWLTHIVANLMDNAVKHGKRGEIRIHAIREPNHFILTVEDLGTLTVEQSRRAFVASYRSEQGTGFHVGLASCKLVMEKHGGVIQLAGLTDEPPNWVIASVQWPLTR